MKNTLILLFVVVVFVSCTTDRVETENIEIENMVSTQKTAAPIIGQILRIKYNEKVTETRMQRIRDYYFHQCYSGSDSNSVEIYYYSVEMYNPYPSDPYLEFWIIISCNNGKPDGIGGGMPGEMIID